MSKLLLIASLFFLSALDSIAAGNVDVNWKKGSSFYDQKQYDSALYYFGQLATADVQNAAVYYNLGNTYYWLNKIGPAVLNYERALRVDPDHKEAKDNLALAQSRISNHISYTGDIFFIIWWQSLTRADHSSAWSVAAAITFILVIILFAIRHLQRSGSKRLPVQLPGVLMFVCACFLILAFAAAKNMQEHNRAVVMQHDAPLMNEQQKGKPLALVPEGTTVKIKGGKGMWLEVTLPDGRSGWVMQTLLAKI